MSTQVRRDAQLGSSVEGEDEMRRNASTHSGTSYIPVLCVDLDGTLIKSDLLWECVLILLKMKPLWLLLAPYWLLRGRANLKRQLARHASLRAASLPYRTELVEFLRAERVSGRQIALVTASERQLADAVAEHLGIFDRVCASDGKTNLRGRAKKELLVELFGESGFDYDGDSSEDMEVWGAAKGGYIVGEEDLARRAESVTEVRRVLQTKRASLKTWLQALRGHHWFKNILLFLPLALAHKLGISA